MLDEPVTIQYISHSHASTISIGLVDTEVFQWHCRWYWALLAMPTPWASTYDSFAVQSQAQHHISIQELYSQMFPS